jgi:biopolymer transport protein ExbD
MPRLASKSIFKRKRSLEEAEMDITPMIDCTFLLLIFFLVTSKMKPELAVDLPKAKHGAVVVEQSSII